MNEKEFEPPEFVKILNAGRLGPTRLKQVMSAPNPLELMGLVKFPVEPGPDGAEVLGIPNADWREINRYDAEVLLFSREGVPGLFMVRRGWDQRWLKGAAENCCGVFLDFRVVVRDVKQRRTAPWGNTKLAYHRASVVIDGRCRYLYVIIVLLITINTSRIGEPMDEQNDDVRQDRLNRGLPVSISSLPRSFVVAHELGHAQDAHDRLIAAINPLLAAICNPDSPNTQHVARVHQAIDTSWQDFVAEGHATEGSSGNYPNNEPERSARSAAWKEYDLGKRGLGPIQIR